MTEKSVTTCYYQVSTCSHNTEADCTSLANLTAAQSTPAASSCGSLPLGKILRTFPELVDHEECIKNLLQVVIDALDHPSMFWLLSAHGCLMQLVVVPWDFHQYVQDSVVYKGNGSSRKHTQLSAKYPNPIIGCVSGPTTFVDSNGNIIAWHLPTVMNKDIQVPFSFQPSLRVL